MNAIEQKYIDNNLNKDYKLKSAAYVKKVLGYDFTTMRGFRGLSDDNKILAEKLICKYINGYGLNERENIRPSYISRPKGINGFLVTFKNNTYSYLYDNGSIG